MRKPLTLFALFIFLVMYGGIFAQDGNRQQYSGKPILERVPHNLRQKPEPPQKFNPLDRNFRTMYYYEGRWRSQAPQSGRSQDESGVCNPGHIVFHGFDYDGVPSYEFVYGYCNVTGHYHGGLWYFGY